MVSEGQFFAANGGVVEEGENGQPLLVRELWRGASVYGQELVKLKMAPLGTG